LTRAHKLVIDILGSAAFPERRLSSSASESAVSDDGHMDKKKPVKKRAAVRASTPSASATEGKLKKRKMQSASSSESSFEGNEYEEDKKTVMNLKKRKLALEIEQIEAQIGKTPAVEKPEAWKFATMDNDEEEDEKKIDNYNNNNDVEDN
jgi:hypothetical protein